MNDQPNPDLYSDSVEYSDEGNRFGGDIFPQIGEDENSDSEDIDEDEDWTKIGVIAT
jgi:hypothetical protein